MVEFKYLMTAYHIYDSHSNSSNENIYGNNQKLFNKKHDILHVRQKISMD